MQVDSVTYEKARSYDTDKFPDAVWHFSVKTDVVFPHGHNGFGGLLRRDAEGLWQARHFGNTDWATHAVQRDQAIQNLLPAAYEAIAKWKQEQATQEERLQARYRAAGVYRQLLQDALPDYKVNVSVNAWDDGKVASGPLKLQIHIEDLTEDELKRIIRTLECPV